MSGNSRSHHRHDRSRADDGHGRGLGRAPRGQYRLRGRGAARGLIGRWVLIHVGFAMSLIDEDEAARTLAALHELGEAQEALEQMAEADREMAR